MNPANRINLIISILTIVLGLPAGAILVSNGALPGDGLYPVKTSIEKIASLLTSPSYQTRSDLEIKLIQRRIEENQQLLLSSGSTEGLNLLVAQAQSAAEYIVKSNTSAQAKSAAIKKLSATIKSTQATLSQERQSLAQQTTTTQNTQTRSTISQGNSPVQNEQTTTSQSNTATLTTNSTDIAQNLADIDTGNEGLASINTYITANDPLAQEAPITTTSKPAKDKDKDKDKNKDDKKTEEDQPTYKTGGTVVQSTTNTGGSAGSGSSSNTGAGSGGSAGSGSSSHSGAGSGGSAGSGSGSNSGAGSGGIGNSLFDDK